MNTGHTSSASSSDPVKHYDASYSHFSESIYAEIRRETSGEDIGQNGWLTAEEQDRFIEWLQLGKNARLLDIACGSGGPTLRIATKTDAKVLGIDLHADGITAAREQTVRQGLTGRASFEIVDASNPLPYDDESFDAITCIDAINHLPDRERVLKDWSRTLKRGGRMLFTDPIVVTGPLTNQEIAIRSSIGFFLFVSPTTDDEILTNLGLEIAIKEDVTQNMADTSRRWHIARNKREHELRRIEGDETYNGQQIFFDVAATIASERRLSRFVYVAVKPT